VKLAFNVLIIKEQSKIISILQFYYKLVIKLFYLMSNTKKYILLILYLISSISLFSQTKIDSLKRILKTQAVDSLKVKTYNELSYEIVPYNQDEAASYARKALKLAKKIKYKKGMGTAFHNLGNACYYASKIDSGLFFYQKALDLRQSIDDKLGMASTLNNLGNIYSYIGNTTKALEYSKKSLDINIQLDDKEGIASSYYTIGSLYENIGNYSEALVNLTKGLDISTEISFKKGQASCYNVIGIIYNKQGNYKKALENYIEGLKINEILGDKPAMADSYNNIGSISERMNHLDDALSYYQKSLKINEELKYFPGIAKVLNNIGNVYKELSDKDSTYTKKAIDNYSKSLAIAKEIGDARIEADCYSNIAALFKESKKYESAILNYQKSLEIKEYFQDMRGVALENIGIGECYYELAQFEKAVFHLQQAYEFGKEANSLEHLNASANLLSLSYAGMKNYKKAFEYSIEQNAINQRLNNDENTKKITQLSMQYEFDKKQKQIEFEQKEKDLANEAKINRQKVLIYSAAIVILLMVMLSVVILRNATIMKAKNTLLAHQKEEIEYKNKSITDSITYASKIQRALLPTDDFGGDFISDHFILLKPRDIVSGDFYWVRQKGNKIFVSAADCTGHGVPGALMSMLGISFLNDILNNSEIEKIEAHLILNELREKIKNSLRQRGKENEAQDGMDMALCVIDVEKYTLEYAGAYNPLYLIRNGELIHFKPDRMPIGIYSREKESFTKYEEQLKSGDALYMFSDGYVDQFDETGENKFMSKPFKRLLLMMQEKSFAEQKQVLEKTLKEWQGNSEQIDDILVMGLKIA